VTSNNQIKQKKKKPIIKVPKIKLKKFRKYKSDVLWEKENANYESLDSEDSIDISKKINKSKFRRSQQMDRIDLTESNLKKKKKIKKELSKTYLTTHEFSSNSMNIQSSNPDQPKTPKIQIFNESEVKTKYPSNQPIRTNEVHRNKSLGKNKKNSFYENRSVNNTSILNQTNEFLPKPLNQRNAPYKRISYSLNRKAKSFNKKKNMNTQAEMTKLKKRFESEDPNEPFKFY
jgi:hypothetical protein